MGGLDQIFYTAVDIPHEDERGFCLFLLSTPGETPALHIILHDLYAIFVFEADTRHFVEGHHIPVAHQTDGTGTHIVEEIGDCRLSAADENGVGGDLFVNERFPRTSGAQLADIVVVLHERDEAGDEMPFALLVEVGGLHARRAKIFLFCFSLPISPHPLNLYQSIYP